MAESLGNLASIAICHLSGEVGGSVTSLSIDQSKTRKSMGAEHFELRLLFAVISWIGFYLLLGCPGESVVIVSVERNATDGNV